MSCSNVASSSVNCRMWSSHSYHFCLTTSSLSFAWLRICLYLCALFVSSTLASCDGGRLMGYSLRVASSSDASVSRTSSAPSRIELSRLASISTSSSDASILSGPFSSRTSSAFLSRLGGKPIGRSSASREAGRLSFRNCLDETSQPGVLGWSWSSLTRPPNPGAPSRHPRSWSESGRPFYGYRYLRTIAVRPMSVEKV